MHSLFAAMLQDKSLQRLQECFCGEASETLAYGLGGSQKHAAVAACYEAGPQPMVIILHSRESLEEWREDLSLLLPGVPVLELPEVDLMEIQAAAKSIERSARRMDVLGRLMRKEKVIILSQAAAAVQKGLSPADFQRLALSIKLGEVLPREKLIQRLTELGYERTEEVERAGQFSARGGIMDIFAINALSPVRLEFFDDEIESLREFDLSTMRSDKSAGLSEITVLPLLQTDSNGKPEPFLSYLGGRGAVIFDEPTRIREQIRTMVKENPEIKNSIFQLGKSHRRCQGQQGHILCPDAAAGAGGGAGKHRQHHFHQYDTLPSADGSFGKRGQPLAGAEAAGADSPECQGQGQQHPGVLCAEAHSLVGYQRGGGAGKGPGEYPGRSTDLRL